MVRIACWYRGRLKTEVERILKLPLIFNEALTKIRSLHLYAQYTNMFVIYLPVFKMCLFLVRLGMHVGALGHEKEMVLALSHALHISCPNLSFLIVRHSRTEPQLMHWALGLLSAPEAASTEAGSSKDTFS